MNILEARGLIKYFGGLTAVSNVDIDVRKGEILGLIGPNGAGKTTLFNLLSGALPPNEGTISFKGTPITHLKAHKITRMGLARTFQAVKIFPHVSVFDNVYIGQAFGQTDSVSKTHGTGEVEEILHFVGLSDFRDTRAGDLILAHQKRLEVARALATRPDVLLLDEVMAGLTPTEVADSMDLVQKIRTRGITIVMIEHVMKAIMTICDRIAVLHHGENIAEGTPDEIVRNKTVIEIYLGE
jgi:branched-chain amino acid transport system ATP-binding protein